MRHLFDQVWPNFQCDAIRCDDTPPRSILSKWYYRNSKMVQIQTYRFEVCFTFEITWERKITFNYQLAVTHLHSKIERRFNGAKMSTKTAFNFRFHSQFSLAFTAPLLTFRFLKIVKILKWLTRFSLFLSVCVYSNVWYILSYMTLTYSTS